MSNKSRLEQYKECKAAMERLKPDVLAELQALESKLESELLEIRNQIAEFTGKPLAEKGPKKAAAKGKLVSADRLKEILNEAEGRKIRIRDHGIDTKCVQQLAAQNPKDFAISGKKPWYFVALKK